MKNVVKVAGAIIGIAGFLLIIGCGGGDPHIVTDTQTNWAAAVGGFGMLGLALWIGRVCNG